MERLDQLVTQVAQDQLDHPDWQVYQDLMDSTEREVPQGSRDPLVSVQLPLLKIIRSHQCKLYWACHVPSWKQDSGLMMPSMF